VTLEASPLVPLPARLAVLLSGRGSNLEALAEGCHDGRIPAAIGAVVSDVAEAPGLQKARDRGLPAFPVVRAKGESRDEHEARILTLLADARVDLVCLAGFMRILSPAFVARFPHRILNIHPSLLPSFPGLHPQRQALDYGARVSGATVHFVDAGMDTGPIVLQRAVPVLGTDDEASLARRILEIEHPLYVEAVRQVLAGGFRIEGRRVVLA
jgi:phosphoribosylglycinamide formyltransferase-1